MNPLTKVDLYNILSVLNCRLSSVECQALQDRRHVWEYGAWHELHTLKQLCGALLYGTLDTARFEVGEVETRLRRATGIGLS